MSQIKYIFRALRYKNYRLFFTGQSISLIGTWIQQIAMGWMVYRLTNSPFLLGLVGFSTQIPAFVVAPFSGVWADRLNRRRILILTQTFSMVQAALLTFLTFSHMVQIWHIIALGFLIGCINAVDIPVRHSFLLEMVEKKENLGNAIALNSLMFNVAKLVGPAIAGILIGWVGEPMCFLINTVSYAAVIVSLYAMNVSVMKNSPATSSLFDSIKEGFIYSFTFQPVRAILILLAIVSFVGLPYTVLMPVFARDVLRGDAQTLGFLVGAAGVGALLGTLYLAGRKNPVRLGRTIPFSTLLFGAGLILFSFSKSVLLSMGILVLIGFGIMVQMAASNTLIQSIVDDDKRGRIMSIYTLCFMGSVPLGNLLIGYCATHYGVSGTVLVSGIVSILGACFFISIMPSLQKKMPPLYQEEMHISPSRAG